MSDNRPPNISSFTTEQQRVIEDTYKKINDLIDENDDLKKRIEDLEDA